MFRTSLLAVSLFLTACGVESPEPAFQEEAPLVAQQPASTAERMEIRELTPQVRPSQLVPLGDLISVHSLDVPDGTQVRYVLGMLGCGISVVGRGTDGLRQRVRHRLRARPGAVRRAEPVPSVRPGGHVRP